MPSLIYVPTVTEMIFNLPNVCDGHLLGFNQVIVNAGSCGLCMLAGSREFITLKETVNIGLYSG